MATDQEPKSRRTGVVVTSALLGGVLIAGPLAGQAWCANNLEPTAQQAAAEASSVVHVRGREARIDATGLSADQADAVKAAVAAVPGIRWVTLTGQPGEPQSSVEPTTTQPASPTTPAATASSTPRTTAGGLRIAAGPSGTELTGSVTTHDDIQAIADQAGRIFGAPVTDSVSVDPAVATPSWYADLGTAMAKFPTIAAGSMTLTDHNVAIAGTVPNLDGLSTLRAAVSTLPTDVDISAVKVNPDWSIQAADAGTTLSGNLGSQDASDALATELVRVFGGPITNNVKVDPAIASPEWMSKLTAALPAFPAITGGGMQVSASGLSISGTVADAAALDALNTALGGIPLTATNAVTAQPAAEPPAQVVPDEVINHINSTVVDFASLNYTLDDTARAKLDAIVPLLQQYPQLRVAVGGYVSLPHDGDQQADSARRAGAVVDYLTNAGIDAGRLDAQGRGSADPVASNDTADGRLANQRATLTVEGN